MTYIGEINSDSESCHGPEDGSQHQSLVGVKLNKSRV